MIQQRSVLKVSDNSGAKKVRCIKVLGGFKKQYAKMGDIIIVSVQQLRNRFKRNSKVKRKEVYKALILRTKLKLKKKNGIKIYFNENSVALLNKQGNPLGTRIIGPVPKILRKKNLQRFISISSGLV
jgi:large subunit ribosomal protein L14